MRTTSLLQMPGSLLLLFSSVLAGQLPYTPTRILLSPHDAEIAYLLQPNPAIDGQFLLSSLDLSKSLVASKLDLQPISSSLPFLDSRSTAPWDAVIDSGGNITVYVGDCGSSGQIWRLRTEGRTTNLEPWSQEKLSQEKEVDDGPRYLSSAIAFSSNTSASANNHEFYIFGGMCPYADSTASNWQGNGNYSKKMISLRSTSESAGPGYQSELATTRNLPISQAGQSLTALQPTYTNHSDDSQAMQQDFVLLGGHTQAAFINMSQVALWSLPQKAWSYFPIAGEDAGMRTDLTVRDTAVQLEPRSGHTSTLSSDGSKIIVVGGWVGNVNTPAQPQVAVLQVAGDYGGSGDWTWLVPNITLDDAAGLEDGIYGHDALMLAGDVMLIVGGYSFMAAQSKVRRQASTLNSRSYLLNISSGVWLPSYSLSQHQEAAPSSDTGPLSRTSQKAGLGIGLGFGAVAVVGLISVYLWYNRRNRRLREEREREIAELEYDPYRQQADSHAVGPAMSQYTHPSIDAVRAPDLQYTEGGWRSTASHAERTGLLVEVPSPTRGLRRNFSGKGQNNFEKRRSGNMEVIEERQDQETSRSSSDDGVQRQTAEILRGSKHDPFSDNSNPPRNHPVHGGGSADSRQSVSERHEEVQGWVSNWEKAAEALMHAPEMARAPDHEGRSSPSKSDRTISMLSDSSAQSSWSAHSGGRGPSGLVRNLSTRSAALLSNFAASLAGTGPIATPATDARATLPSQQRRLSYSLTTSGAPSSPTRRRPDTATSTIKTDGDSYSTAQTSFAQLQAEGEALLGASRSRGISEPSSPAKEKKDEGWLGSVRRVMSGSKQPSSMTNATRRQDPRSGSTSSFRDGESLPPQRATSDASFLRSRRGAQDWRVEDEPEDPRLQRPSAPGEDAEDEWDVERAAQDRVVQLMFTVPRQRLRIVNADDSDARSSLSHRDER